MPPIKLYSIFCTRFYYLQSALWPRGGNVVGHDEYKGNKSHPLIALEKNERGWDLRSYLSTLGVEKKTWHKRNYSSNGFKRMTFANSGANAAVPLSYKPLRTHMLYLYTRQVMNRRWWIYEIEIVCTVITMAMGSNPAETITFSGLSYKDLISNVIFNNLTNNNLEFLSV